MTFPRFPDRIADWRTTREPCPCPLCGKLWQVFHRGSGDCPECNRMSGHTEPEIES